MKLKPVERRVAYNNDDTFYFTKDKGEFTYFCPDCGTPNRIKINSKISIRGSENAFICFKVFIKCRNCGKKFENKDSDCGIDPNISNAIITLNKLGFRTIGCCEGHTDKDGNIESAPYILFKNNDIIKYGCPEGWYFITSDTSSKTTLHYDVDIYGYDNHTIKIKALTSLYTWISKISIKN